MADMDRRDTDRTPANTANTGPTRTGIYDAAPTNGGFARTDTVSGAAPVSGTDSGARRWLVPLIVLAVILILLFWLL